MKKKLLDKSREYLQFLCQDIQERCVGSEGNRKATDFYKRIVRSFGWETEILEFEAMDWQENSVVLRGGEQYFQARVSPYSLGCELEAELLTVSSPAELEEQETRNKILLLHGDIASEQLMPKKFIFYNPEDHKYIISRLEASGAAALICATGFNGATAGGVSPFPLIEDGDFNIPSVFMTDEEGKSLSSYKGRKIYLRADARRIPGKGYNVTACRGKEESARVVITAHIDAKKGTPGAIDNATGVIVLLLLAELLRDYKGTGGIELVAFNGEDYFSVPGQMRYLAFNRHNFSTISLNINIDGAGYNLGAGAYSYYNLPPWIERRANGVLKDFSGIKEGASWVQGDHSIFIQNGCPAIAFSSDWFTEHIDTQTITHTPADHAGIVDCGKVLEIAEAIAALVKRLGAGL